MICRVLVLLAAVGLLSPQDAISSPVRRPATLAQNEAATKPSMASPIDLVWSAPADCPDGSAVRSEVLRLAGTRASLLHHLKAQASIRPAAGPGWILSLATDLDGVAGERTLSGVSCESLSDAAALMLALILNPEVKVAKPARADAQEPAPPPTSTVSANHDNPRRRLTWVVGAHAGAEMGVLADLSPSFMLTLGVGLGRFSMRLVPSLTPPQNVYRDAKLGLGGRLWVGTLAVLGCWTRPIGRFGLSPCLGVDVARLQGRGLGVLQQREATVYWASAELALLAGLSLGHGVSFELGGIGLVPFGRPTVYLDDIGSVSRPAAFGFAVVGGLGWVFD